MQINDVTEILRAGLAGVQLLRSIGVTADEVNAILNGEELTEEELQARLGQRERSIESRIENDG